VSNGRQGRCKGRLTPRQQDWAPTPSADVLERLDAPGVLAVRGHRRTGNPADQRIPAADDSDILVSGGLVSFGTSANGRGMRGTMAR
jgi:hypothetical protein